MDTLEKRFWKYVKKSHGCWLWTGTRRPDGYGVIGRGKRGKGLIRAHRLSWELVNGLVPVGKFVCHKCDNPSCVRPGHLFLGTNLDNIRDMRMKCRGVDPPVQYGEKNVNAKMSPYKVKKIRRLHASGVSYKKLSVMFDVYWGTIRNLVTKRTWKHVADT